VYARLEDVLRHSSYRVAPLTALQVTLMLLELAHAALIMVEYPKPVLVYAAVEYDLHVREGVGLSKIHQYFIYGLIAPIGRTISPFQSFLIL
jgi:hypothetical protein